MMVAGRVFAMVGGEVPTRNELGAIDDVALSTVHGPYRLVTGKAEVVVIVELSGTLAVVELYTPGSPN